jgi:uncharacterized protein involved in response to NO
MTPIPRLRPYAGPALLSYGFRPFFLLGAIFAALAVLIWMPVFEGEVSVPTAFVPRDWHVHEMIFGYAAAVVTGFLLTAIPNWTGRLPLQGAPLVLLIVTWLAGRIAVSTSGIIGWWPAMIIDLAFLLLVAAAATREIVTGENWGNLKVVAILGLLVAANAAFHIEAHFAGVADTATRIALAAIIMLIMIIGGRIVPSFTRNWLARENPGRLPTPFGRFDVASLALAGGALVLWIGAPATHITAAALIAAGLVQAVRLARWAGDRTLRDRLVLVLHAAYAFVPLGFVLTGLAALGWLGPSAGAHAWTVGAVGTMTLAVMTRASLGHTGRTLAASAATQAIYAAVLAAAAARVCAALEPQWSFVLLHVAALCWAAAFFGFAVAYAPVLLRPRVRAAG